MSYHRAAPPTHRPDTWQDDAACGRLPLGSAVDFDTLNPYDARKAGAVCLECPVRATCLADALNDVDAAGVRGAAIVAHARIQSVFRYCAHSDCRMVFVANHASPRVYCSQQCAGAQVHLLSERRKRSEAAA